MGKCEYLERAQTVSLLNMDSTAETMIIAIKANIC